MLRFFLSLWFIFSSVLHAQFKFFGQVSEEYFNTTIYLCEINDYRKTKQFLPENILTKTTIDSLGNFAFSGNFLSEKNKIYKLFVDLKSEEITDSKHLLGKCETCAEKLFIANNKDTISFPLNNLNQMLCEVEATNKNQGIIQKIDSLQEILLSNVGSAISDTERQIIYNEYFQSLQKFGTSFKDPIAELYAYHLYSDNQSFSRVFYLDDLKISHYYENLLKRLKKSNSPYFKQFQSELNQDNYSKTTNLSLYKSTTYTLLGLLFISIGYIFYLRKKSTEQSKKMNYKEVLTTQEQRVFELMNQQKPNKQIADELFVSLSTVKTHINSIYNKLSIKNRKEIAQFFEK